jgi:hypothetical protein
MLETENIGKKIIMVDLLTFFSVISLIETSIEAQEELLDAIK